MKPFIGTSCLFLLYLASTAITAQADSHSVDGQAAYENACESCHKGGWFTGGAPKTGDAKAWAGRVEKGQDALVSATLNGIGNMQARGGCAECSDAEISAAVAYMLQALE